MKQIVKTSLAIGTSLSAIVALVAVPTLQVFAVSATPADTTITATVAPVISLSAGAAVGFTLTPSAGVAESNATQTVTVTTNNTAGYTLNIADKDATLTLGSTSPITASTALFGTSALLTTGTWGYAVVGAPAFSASYSSQTDVTTSTLKYAGILATPQVIKTTAVTASADPTVLWFAAKVASTQPTGTYADVVTYSATTN